MADRKFKSHVKIHVHDIRPGDLICTQGDTMVMEVREAKLLEDNTNYEVSFIGGYVAWYPGRDQVNWAGISFLNIR